MIRYIQYLLLTTLLVGAVNSFAQYNSEKGWFTVNEIRGCTGLQVEIISINTVSGAPCVCFTDCGPECALDYEGDGVFDSKSSPLIKTYDQSGNFELVMLFPGQLADRIKIEVIEKDEPDFNVYTCAGRQIQVDILDTQYDNYIIDYRDGTNETVPVGSPTPEHTYPDLGARRVTVRGVDNNSAPNCPISFEDIVPVTVLSPSIISTLSLISSDSLLLEYNLQPDVKQQLEISVNGATNFSPLFDIINDDINDQIPNERTPIKLDLEENYYCFRIATFDPCQGNNVIFGYSNIICSVDLDVSFEDGVNKLVWATESPSTNFRIEKNEDVTTQSNTVRSVDDTDVLCEVEYCYTIVADYGSGITSRSLQRCGIGISTEPPASVKNLSLAVNGENIDLIWPENMEVNQYSIFRDGTLINSTEEAIHTESNLNTSEISYCYRINSEDQCGNINRDGIEACSMLLSGSIDRSNMISLDWNDYTGWNMGVNNYTITKSYPGGASQLFNSAVSMYSEVDDNNSEQVIVYTVTANANEAGVDPSLSNTITLIKPNNIYYPNAFTPDKNGTNDTFAVMGRYITEYDLRLYSRWGEEIFISDNPENGWDGRVNGRPQQGGVYAFTCTIKDQAGREVVTKGAVMLLRK